MTYGNRRDFPKIDIYAKRAKGQPLKYLCSTTWARTCRKAVERYATSSDYAASDLKAHFSR